MSQGTGIFQAEEFTSIQFDGRNIIEVIDFLERDSTITLGVRTRPDIIPSRAFSMQITVASSNQATLFIDYWLTKDSKGWVSAWSDTEYRKRFASELPIPPEVAVPPATPPIVIPPNPDPAPEPEPDTTEA